MAIWAVITHDAVGTTDRRLLSIMAMRTTALV